MHWITGPIKQPQYQWVTTTGYWVEDIPSRPANAPWAPPWMHGDLAAPNAAKVAVPHPLMRLRSEGVVAGEILAWRAWYWDAQVRRLRSLFVDYHWPVDAPATGEPARGYGLHAFKETIYVQHEYSACYSDVTFGQVALWGDVVEYDHGYCAEFGKVHSLINSTPEIRALYKAEEGSWK